MREITGWDRFDPVALSLVGVIVESERLISQRRLRFSCQRGMSLPSSTLGAHSMVRRAKARDLQVGPADFIDFGGENTSSISRGRKGSTAENHRMVGAITRVRLRVEGWLSG